MLTLFPDPINCLLNCDFASKQSKIKFAKLQVERLNTGRLPACHFPSWLPFNHVLIEFEPSWIGCVQRSLD